GAPAQLALQSNRTGFGDQGQIIGGLTSGSEADALYVRNDDNNLYIGIAGNLEVNGNAYLVFIDADDNGATGQNELKTQGVDGPPFTLQNLGQPTSDCMTFGTGTLLPAGFGADYVVAVDTFGGTMFISEYTLHSTSIGTYLCNGIPAPLYASRIYAGSSPTNDNNDVLEGSQGLGYAGGFNNTNTAGVTDTSGASASTATTGLELAVPLARFGLTASGATIKVLVLLASGGGTGPNGTVHNQSLPHTNSSNCSPPVALGLQPNLSADPFATHVLAAGNATPSPLDGQDIGGTFGAGALKATQTCPTSAGDQVPNPTMVTYTGGSELDALYASNDGQYLYLGITGNIETNGNAVLIFVDSVAGGERILSGNQGGPAVPGMEGDALPLAPDDSEVDYDFAYAINAGGGGNTATHPYYVDFLDLQANTGTYRGSGTAGSGSGALSGGTNPNNLQIAYDRTNIDGVHGCGDDVCPSASCFCDSVATVMSQAATATKGFEVAIPFADIGVGTLPATVKLWVFVASGGGYGSDQGLPSVRGTRVTMKSNAGDGPTDFTSPIPGFPTPNTDYAARAAIYSAAAVVATVTAANPPLPDANPYESGQVYRDVLDTGGGLSLTEGIGAGGTANQGGIQYSPILVTYSGAPTPAPSTGNVTLSCTRAPCPVITSVAPAGGNTFAITLSGAIPPLGCTTLTLPTNQKVQYRSHPGNVNLDNATNTQDLLALVTALNNGSANQAGNLARYNVDRDGGVNTQDLLRTVQLLNGVNTTQVFAGAGVDACPP
ncbi:MAG TPA: hypothetical protein VGM03_10310, partial [Phycisphaerae bacterium]